MQKEIHPTYFPKTNATCVCGGKFTFGSTKEEIRVEICSQCHPFFTGKENIVDSAGRVERFKKKVAASKPTKAKAKK